VRRIPEADRNWKKWSRQPLLGSWNILPPDIQPNGLAVSPRVVRVARSCKTDLPQLRASGAHFDWDPSQWNPAQLISCLPKSWSRNERTFLSQRRETHQASVSKRPRQAQK